MLGISVGGSRGCKAMHPLSQDLVSFALVSFAASGKHSRVANAQKPLSPV